MTDAFEMVVCLFCGIGIIFLFPFMIWFLLLTIYELTEEFR